MPDPITPDTLDLPAAEHPPTPRQVRAVIDEYMRAHGVALGCGDNSCRLGPPGGMATNGGCRCLGRTMGDFERIPPIELRSHMLGLLQVVRAMADELAQRRR